jgi:hypothetical protein
MQYHQMGRAEKTLSDPCDRSAQCWIMDPEQPRCLQPLTFACAVSLFPNLTTLDQLGLLVTLEGHDGASARWQTIPSH